MTRPAPRPDPGDARDPRTLPYPHRRPASLGPLRLTLFTRVSRTWHGIWLPHSRDLTREGADLVDDFPTTRGRIDRLACSPEEWEGDVSSLFTAHGRISVGRLAARDGQRLVLVGLVGGEVLRLRVAWT